MTPVGALALLVLLTAASWSVVVAARPGDMRHRGLAALLGLVVLAHLLPTIAQIQSWGLVAGGGNQLPTLGVGVLALLGIVLLDRISTRHGSVQRRLGVHRAFLEELFETSGEPIVLLDEAGRVVQVNGAFTAIFEYSPGEVLGRPVDELLAPSGRLEELRQITRSLLSGKRIQLESVLQRKNGSLVDVSILAAPVRIAGVSIAAFAMYRDITGVKRVEDALRQMEHAVATMQLGVTVTDLKGRIVYTNPADAALHGYTPEELIGKDVRIFAPHEQAQPLGRRQIEAIKRWRRDTVNVRKDGTEFPAHLMSDVVRDASGEAIGIVTTCEDITQRKRAERALQESEERYALAIRGANDGLWDWNLETGDFYYSHRWKTMLGYGDTEIPNTPEAWLSRVHEEDLPKVEAELEAHRSDRSSHFENEHRIRQKDGTYRWVLARGIAERDPEGKPYRIAGSLTDIQQRKTVEAQLAQEALYDSLTKLPNRAFLNDLLNRSFRRTKRRRDYVFAVMFVDLDQFKLVNDSLGHAAGDKLLVEVGRRLKRCLRPGDVVARLGGDEFLVLLDDIKDSSDTTRVAERIQMALQEPADLGGREVFTTASIGIAVSEGMLDGPEHLIRHADSAMYRAKASGKARYEIFDRAMHDRAVNLLQLETDIRAAVHKQQFRLVYLPVVNMGTERVAGFEALVRWEHPERGLVAPASFVPLAEETGLIIPLGRWILEEACRQMVEWAKRYPDLPDLTMSVNLSARQLRQPDLVEQITDVVTSSGLAPNRLKLEIAETVLMDDPEANLQAVSDLHDFGVLVQIDDFGTGSSSLSYLNRFRVDTLKIDRSFISQVGVPGEKTAVVQAMITLAEQLGIGVIAEGVETPLQSEHLMDLHCDQAQGYLFSEPLTAQQAEDLLEAEVKA
jgi:diguanylate cyclase (GGDEF)-like protein/PAS domain S-box-containing protein